MNTRKSLVEKMADTIFATYPSAPVDTALALVAEVAKRQRLNAVRDFARGKEPIHISRQHQIIGVVCRTLAVTQEDLLGPSRKQTISVARWVAWKLMQIELGMNCAQIAKFFDRDHTTVSHGFDKIEARPDLVQKIAELSQHIRSLWGIAVEAAE